MHFSSLLCPFGLFNLSRLLLGVDFPLIRGVRAPAFLEKLRDPVERVIPIVGPLRSCISFVAVLHSGGILLRY